jgi:hypothetical protein
MIRSETLEHFLLEYGLGPDTDGHGHPATIGQLFNDVNRQCFECDYDEIFDALYNLSSEHATLQRFLPNGHSVNFEKVRIRRDWKNFFTIGEFRLKTLPGGRKRFELLSEQIKSEHSRADSTRPTTDYSDLTEFQLQDLAINNRIPSKMKMTPSGETPVWDKQHVIDWLRNRDRMTREFSRSVLEAGNVQRADDQMKTAQYVIDVLICHATEDKGYVEPLAEALKQVGISTWYDRFSLHWGDDLRRKIDEGLKDCTFGIVVFSPTFLKVKKWTEYELSGLFAKEKEGTPPVILPILHNITIEDLAAYAPSLSTRLAKNSSTDSIQDIIRALKSMLGRSGST